MNEILFPPPGETPREDTAAVMRFYELPKGFSKGVLADARKAARELAADHGDRLDLRKKFIFTCDPVTARDYDDALSLEKDRKGNRVLGVHIADVSHFVKPGSALDKEAYRRSTSVYLVDRVIPMLPEELSNGVCSLVPGEDRLAFSVFMTFDSEGKMIKRTFAKSVINSKARYTYEEVMKVLRGEKVRGEKARGEKVRGEKVRDEGVKGEKARKTIREISELAQQLRKARFDEGALDLEVPEAEVMLDDEGEMTGIVTRPYDESHQMIEEAMVAANEAVAKELWTKGIRILSRLHESPDPEKIEMLRTELKGLGIRAGDLTQPKAFVKFLKSIKTHPLYPTLSTMVLRSMKKAVYDSRSIGHFGLAKKYYAHFTSPIRRYPDLTLHRQLADYLVKPNTAKRPPEMLERWAKHTSEREQIATEAERGLLEIKKYRLLEAQLSGAEGGPLVYDAVISKCMPFGCFVEIPEIAVSGLVHISNLANAYVTFDDSTSTLNAGTKRWRVGDRMKVRVASVDFRNRKLDFLPVKERR